MLNKMVVSKFGQVTLEKNKHGSGPSAFQCFRLLKKDTRTFNFRSNELSHDILGPVGSIQSPLEKKTTKNEITHIRDLSSG